MVSCFINYFRNRSCHQAHTNAFALRRISEGKSFSDALLLPAKACFSPVVPTRLPRVLCPRLVFVSVLFSLRVSFTARPAVSTRPRWFNPTTFPGPAAAGRFTLRDEDEDDGFFLRFFVFLVDDDGDPLVSNVDRVRGVTRLLSPLAFANKSGRALAASVPRCARGLMSHLRLLSLLLGVSALSVLPVWGRRR